MATLTFSQIRFRPGDTISYIADKNKMFTWLNYLNAGVLLSTTPGLEVYQWKRSKDVMYYVHIPHAAGEITLYRMFGIDYYDSILYSGEFQANDIRALEKLRNLPEKELVEGGIPYLDEMAKRPYAETIFLFRIPKLSIIEEIV